MIGRSHNVPVIIASLSFNFSTGNTFIKKLIEYAVNAIKAVSNTTGIILSFLSLTINNDAIKSINAIIDNIKLILLPNTTESKSENKYVNPAKAIGLFIKIPPLKFIYLH